MSSDPFWLVVTCGSIEQATRIGDAALSARLVSCFDVLPRARARYFWPPGRGTIEESAGALLILETFGERIRELKALVRSEHNDELPFMGAIRLEHVDGEYRDWIERELARTSDGDIPATKS